MIIREIIQNLKNNLHSLFEREQGSLSNFSQRGFTILETLVATGMAAVVITSALGVFGTIYFTQKRVQFSQDFFAESRYLMERLAQEARNNTIDYDRFFVEIGPGNTNCSGFKYKQIPTFEQAGRMLSDNNASNRGTLQYPTIFYWDVNAEAGQDRNLGGLMPGGEIDDCAVAWPQDYEHETLYLINASRTLRTAIRFATPSGVIEIQRQLGADTNGDGQADIWGPFDGNDDGKSIDTNTVDIKIQWDDEGKKCQLWAQNPQKTGSTKSYEVFGDDTNEDICKRAHDWAIISPTALQINDLKFFPSPNRDPYLAFRVEEAQIHPLVGIFANIELRHPDRQGFDATNKPQLKFQTAVSSRVFGDIRR